MCHKADQMKYIFGKFNNLKRTYTLQDTAVSKEAKAIHEAEFLKTLLGLELSLRYLQRLLYESEQHSEQDVDQESEVDA